MTALPAATARRPARPINLKPHKRSAAIAGALAAIVVVAAAAHGPRFDILFAASPVIQAHVYAAIGAFVLGGVLLLARKGGRFHVAAGWTWVGLMAVGAIASLFITGVNGDWWSWIHILSGLTLLMLPLAVRAARKRNLKAHRALMLNLYVGGMLVAGGFTFAPGRLMNAVFLGG